jgi:hypothetical protein
VKRSRPEIHNLSVRILQHGRNGSGQQSAAYRNQSSSPPVDMT